MMVAAAAEQEGRMEEGQEAGGSWHQAQSQVVQEGIVAAAGGRS